MLGGGAHPTREWSKRWGILRKANSPSQGSEKQANILSHLWTTYDMHIFRLYKEAGVPRHRETMPELTVLTAATQRKQDQ